MQSSPQPSTTGPIKYNNAGKPLPDIGLKWGKSPASLQQQSNTTTNSREPNPPSSTPQDITPSNPTQSLHFSNSISSPPSPPSSADKTNNDKPNFETFYTEAEKEKLRSKGINPALKAEMEYARYGNVSSNSNSNGIDGGGRKKKRGFWGKVAGTGFGGGFIK